MNYNKTKHKVLKLFVELRLNYIEEYHGIRDLYLTLDEIVKKEKLSYDVVKLILASLLANKEIRFNNSINEDEFSGYTITNEGVFAYEDKKYLRIKTERSRAGWSFIISIVSFLLSLIAIYLTTKEKEKEEQPKINTTQTQKKISPLETKKIDSVKIKNQNSTQTELPKNSKNATTANSG